MAFDSTNKGLIFAFRLLMAWTFLYAASHQVFDPNFSITGFLNSTKTFHSLFAVFAGPGIAPVVGFLVAYGHLLIGLSLLSGLMVRISSIAGIGLLITYWMAHMNFPFVENSNNFIVDYHIVYCVVLVFLIHNRAGHILGLDALIEKGAWISAHPRYRAFFGEALPGASQPT